MEAVLEDFELRAEEVRSYLRLLKEMDKPGSQLHNPSSPGHRAVMIEEDWRKVSKATAYLLIYNLVESSIRSAFGSLYQVIEGDGCTLRGLSRKMLDQWIDQKHRSLIRETASPMNYKETAAAMVQAVLEDQVARLLSEKLHLSGNLDADVIRELCQSHDVPTTVPPSTKGGVDLSVVKAQRNALAHGNKSFSECGREVTVADLERIAGQTEGFVRAILRNVERVVETKAFKATPTAGPVV
jgi:hypothetical protein